MIVAGVDEVGRGALAGPVFAAAVVLADDCDLCVQDSKSLSPKKRLLMDELIRAQALDYKVASASVLEIEDYNVLGASLLAMRRSLEGLNQPIDQALIDGLHAPVGAEAAYEVRTLVKGDQKHASIAAASILAKVARDRYMSAMDKYYPGYFFTKHKGYPTVEHIECLDECGICPIHRIHFKPVKRRMMVPLAAQ